MAYTYKKRVNTDSKHSINYPNNNPFEKNPSTGGNCTWWAWGRFKEVYKGATNKDLKWTAGAGNACSFYRIMGKAGYSTGKTPKPGAIVCWGYNGTPEGSPGHVAFVEYVYDNGDIEISQSGWSSGPLANKKITKKSGYKYGYNNDYFNGFIYNKVTFTNPDGTISASTSKPRSWYISKYGTGAEVYFLLKDAGYTHKACCAVLGNMQQESGIRVYTGGSFDGNGSEGLCQWTFGRKTAMQKYAKAHSKTKSWKSVDGQVAYLIYELNTSEKAANIVLKNNSLTLKEMTEEFERKFERAADWAANLTARVKYANNWYKWMSGSSQATGSMEEEETAYGIDMQKRASNLYSSDNYEWLTLEESEEARQEKERVSNQLAQLTQKITATKSDLSTGAIPESIAITGVDLTQTRESSVKVSSQLNISDALVEAPFIELDFNGYIIGSISGDLDTAPNYVSQLDVTKVNGEINKYTIQVVYQIRPGEDPNKLDELFSQVRYDKIKLRYGDASTNSLFKDTEAIITNITQNRDYTGMSITYSISATSACNYVSTTPFDFPAVTDKPSNVIRSLLYNKGSVSQLLLDAFPGMQDRLTVNSNNWLPSNDTVVNIPAKTNLSVTQYISYLTSIMSNQSNATNAIIRNSVYYLTYQDDAKNGSYFKINEVTKATKTSVATSYVYDVNINFPDDNQVYNFSVNNDNAWSLLYEYADKPQEYVYDINEEGITEKIYSPNYFSSSQQMNEIQKNWWTQMTEYPISAQLSMKGLLTPISLMDYLNIDVRFYGVKHMTSGLYVITSQQDTLSGSGFRTNLGLVRVGDSTTPSVSLQRTHYISRKSSGADFKTATIQFPNYQPEVLEGSDWYNKIASAYSSAVQTNKTNINVVKNESTSSDATSSEATYNSSSIASSKEIKVCNSYQFKKIGNTFKLNASYKDTITYSSEDEKVATVDKNGIVTAIGAGNTNIVLKSGNITEKVKIRVPATHNRYDALSPWLDALKAQAEWSKDCVYNWTLPTIANSKNQATCITFPAVAAQRCGILDSKEYLTGSGNTGTKDLSLLNASIKRCKNKKYYWSYQAKPLKTVGTMIKSGKILPGDIVGSWTHTYVYAGMKDGEYRWHEGGHSGGQGKHKAGPAMWHKNNSNATATCVAVFRIKVYNFNSSCVNGKITKSNKWMAGQKYVVTYTPDDGYELESIKVDGKAYSITKYPKSITFKDIKDNHSVVVKFKAKN